MHAARLGLTSAVIDSRLQRLLLAIDVPGALPQAENERARLWRYDSSCRAECIGPRNKSTHLNGLDQFALRRDFSVEFLGFKHSI